jgi:SAM-dependent methyltransferase
MIEVRQSHWQRVYTDKEPTDVSWYQRVPAKSLQLIHATDTARSEPVLDAGGGASTLVDQLLAEGHTDISVLDVSGKALERSRERLGDRAAAVQWIESDVTAFEPSRRYEVWHDRAVFHFLTDPVERAKYIDVLERALLPGGHLLLATFGPEGPERCSGLPVQRYDIGALKQLFSDCFELRSHELDVHQTPSGSAQQFLYSWWQRTNSDEQSGKE